MNKIINAIKKYGIYGCLIKCLNKITYRIFRFFNRLDIKLTDKRTEKIRKFNEAKYKYLEEKIKDDKYKFVFVFYPYVEWNLPIFQRPHQIALELSKRDDVLYFFCSSNCNNDNIENVYEQINDNLFVVTDYDFLCNVDTNKRVIHLYSADTISDYKIVEEALDRKDKVLYEYIDEIHEEITHSLPEHYLEKHHKILKNENCYVIATADKLYNDIKKVRKKNFALATNGVNIADFIRNEVDIIPDEIKDLKAKYKKLICYYGALAVWFDYELVRKISHKFPDYAIALIGVEYDDAFKKSQITNLPNVHYLGKKNYYDLHKYSENTDLLIIPFLLNEITESTSPVKLFEYMATNVPILTTNMKECRKYKSVIIGKNHDDFLDKIDSTIDLINDPKYLALETKEAEENTWKQKSETIIELLEKGEKNAEKNK